MHVNGFVGIYIVLPLLEHNTLKMSLIQHMFPTTLVLSLFSNQSRFAFNLFLMISWSNPRDKNFSAAISLPMMPRSSYMT